MKIYNWLVMISLGTLVMECDENPSTVIPQIPEETSFIDSINTGIPIIIIDADKSVDLIEKNGWINAKIRWGTKNGLSTQCPVQIKGRGNSTWQYPKKPYCLKFSNGQTPLGLPKDKRWVLLANYRDKTLLRNEIAFEISRRTGLKWAPKTEYAELFINNTHMGNYQLTEHIEISKDKINIDDEEGYLFEVDTKYDEKWKFKTELRNLPIMIREPDIDDQKLTELQNYFNTIETVLYDDNFRDENEGYKKYIDINSFIDWYIIQELMGNGEPNLPKSVFMTKDKNSEKLVMGPVWDFDWATCGNPKIFCIPKALWYERLFEDSSFVSIFKSRWKSLMPKLSDLNAIIEEKGSYLNSSQELNCDRWDLNDTDLIGPLYNCYDEYINSLKTYFDNRINWLDNKFSKF